ncbi:MAG: hypothetical protein GX032_00775 [Tenericutes bacterium]|nr:YtxH domain-containing protein [Bacilli bacterium]MDD4624424.1 YtxH domain-containing protein [Bacilli bacterium]MDD4831385.1 YtxH domain-containing protein [Bacilli bacterium]NLV89994.1 hypothetical protein [Mycoplasmatota bacterium]
MKRGSKFALGAILGAGLGLLFAPKTGKETRQDLSKKMTEMFDQLKDLDMEEVKVNIEGKIKEINKEIKSLDKEKVIEMAKEKGEVLAKKAGELVDLAKQSGKPVVEEATKSIKTSISDLAKQVIEKLEADKDKK